MKYYVICNHDVLLATDDLSEAQKVHHGYLVMGFNVILARHMHAA